LLSLHDHNEAQRPPELVQRCGAAHRSAGGDAGTPAISDRGSTCTRGGGGRIEVVAIPGLALRWGIVDRRTADGSFCFEGFPAARGSARRARLDELKGEPRTLVFL